MPNTNFREAGRSHTSLLAAAEKRTLIRMAQRLPLWVNSDHLTALGFGSLVVAGACYWFARWNPLWLLCVIPCLALNWFGDSLDGTLARVRNQQRPRYGFYVDHILDAIGTVFLLSGLAFSGYMSPAFAYGFLVVYLLLSIEIHLAAYTVGKFHLSYWSFGPTELRILLGVGNLALLRDRYVAIAGHRARLFDLGFTIGAFALSVILVQAVVRHTVMLYREETRPASQARPTS